MCLGAMGVSKEKRRSLFVAQLSGRRREATKTEDLPIEQALVLDGHKELRILQQLLFSARDKAQEKGSLPKGASMDVEQLWTVMNSDRDEVITYLELEEFLKGLRDFPLQLDEVAKALGIKQGNEGIKQTELRAKVLIDLPFDEEVGPTIATRLHDLREEAQTNLETNGGDVVQSLIGDKISEGAAAAAAAALAAAAQCGCDVVLVPFVAGGLYAGPWRGAPGLLASFVRHIDAMLLEGVMPDGTAMPPLGGCFRKVCVVVLA